MHTHRIGTISVPGGGLPTESEKKKLRERLKEINCIPIFLDPEILENAYKGYCKQVMWPVFHNIDLLDHIHAAWSTPMDWSDKMVRKT